MTRHEGSALDDRHTVTVQQLKNFQSVGRLCSFFDCSYMNNDQKITNML